ncbi:MAG: glycosyltransferase [Candidatus Omnitrophica bacterium]|nr:glycosyltransferase [Candidatus Omnitrophota bacterium]
MDEAIEVILPVYNEQELLRFNVLKLRDFLILHDFDFLISIVDNGSLDDTFNIAQNLAAGFSGIRSVKLKTKGRGGALRYRIEKSDCSIVAYMDVDLSADLNYFLVMYNNIRAGNDIAIGSRLIDPSLVTRSCFRSFLSRNYSILVKNMLRLPFFDYQCGFKMFRRRAVLDVLPFVENNNWFFDTELLFYAYRRKLKIKELAIAWDAGQKTKVKIFRTIIEDIRGIVRLKLNDKF